MYQVMLSGANHDCNISLIIPNFTIVWSRLSLPTDNSDNNNDDISEEYVYNSLDVKLRIDAEISMSCQRSNLKTIWITR